MGLRARFVVADVAHQLAGQVGNRGEDAAGVAEVLSAIYEVDFLSFSYGFRPDRSPHQALEALHTASMTQNVNWVLDADVRSFLDRTSYCPQVHEMTWKRLG
jgi:hypothetical protein